MSNVKSEPLLSVRHVSKRFPVGKSFFGRANKFVHAVNDVSFDVMPGETFSIVGESGCGKSTTSRLINRLIDPNEGEVYFDGQEISKLPAKEFRPLRAKMQMVFQDPYGSLNPRMKVQDIIAEPLLVHTNLSAGERLKRAQELLGVVGLSPTHGERYPHEFSGGQRQRIGIARALAVDPEFIVLDEPISALDVSIQAQVVNLLIKLQKEMGLTYLFVAHDLSMVKHISDRIAVLYLGTLVELATSEELFANPLHPYTKALLKSLPTIDTKKEEELISIPGTPPDLYAPPQGCGFASRCEHCMKICQANQPPVFELGEGHTASCWRLHPDFPGKKEEK